MSLLKKFISNQKKYLYDAKTNRLHEIDETIAKAYHNYTVHTQTENDILTLSDVLQRNIDNNFFTIKEPFSKENLSWICHNTMQQLILSITENCNMRCKYCTYHDKYSENYICNEMTCETAEKAIELFLKNSIKNEEIFISFYGGEPLTRKEFIKHCVNYALNKSNGQHIKFYITTNGTLLDENFIDYLIEYNFYVSISLDGPREINDRYRVFKDGSPTYDKVVCNLKQLYYKNPIYAKNNVILMCTYSPPKNEPAIYSFFENVPFRSLINEVIQTPYFKTYVKDRYLDTHDITLMFDEKINYNHYRKSIEANYKKYANLTPIHKDTQYIFPSGSCIPINKKLFVKDNGNIFFCERVNEDDPSNIVGNVKEGVDITSVMQQYERLIGVFKKQRCGECWAVHFCTFCFRDAKTIDDIACERMRNRIEQEFTRFLSLNKNA